MRVDTVSPHPGHSALSLDRLAARYYEDLAPAIDRVWTDEVESMRTDLKGWVHQVANEEGEWVPIRAELGFGFPAAPGQTAAEMAGEGLCRVKLGFLDCPRMRNERAFVQC